MLGTPKFGESLPFFSAAPFKLCQVGWGALLQSYFQVFPEMFDRVQVWALTGPLKDIQRRSHSCVVLAVCLGLLSFWKVDLRPKSEVLSTVEQVFIKYISVLYSVRLCLDLD